MAVPEAAGGAPSGKSGFRPATAFSLDVQGFDSRWLSRVEPFTIALQPGAGGRSQPYIGGSRLTLTVADGGIDPWLQWHESFVLQGSNGPDAERSLTLTFFKADRSSALTRKGTGVGILSVRYLGPAPGGARVGSSLNYQVDLYVERWQVQ